MYILMVRLKVKDDRVDDFIEASIGDGVGSVLGEPNCYRFDIIQDDEDPTKFAFCEVYEDEAAFQYHTMAYHFHQWRDASADMFAEPPEVSFCRSVYPAGPAEWDAYRPGAVDDPAFQNGTLHVIHAPAIRPSRQSRRLHRSRNPRRHRLDTRRARLLAVRRVPERQRPLPSFISTRSTRTETRSTTTLALRTSNCGATP